MSRDRCTSRVLLVFSITIICGSAHRTTNAQPTRLAGAGTDLANWQLQIRDAVSEAIRTGDLPGAVIGIWHNGQWKLREAIGARQIEPTHAAMSLDTIFDLASLTKPVATATSAMILAQQGKIELDAPVHRYLPEFVGEGRETVLDRKSVV